MHDELKRTYLRLIKGLAKWGLIVMLAAAAGSIVAAKLLVPEIESSVKRQAKGTKVKRAPGGRKLVVYGDSKTPVTRVQELAADGPQLIYQNQARYYRRLDDEDGTGDLAPVPPPARRALASAAARFLRAWETYRAGESPASYRARLAPFTDPSSLDDIAARSDNQQGRGVGPGLESGSRVPAVGFGPATNMTVLRYDGQSASVSALGEAVYTGPSLIWKGTHVMRTYTLVMRRSGGRWRVERAAAATMGPIT